MRPNNHYQQEFEYDIFLSYSSKDKPAVVKLAKYLHKNGLRVWFDDWIVQTGDDIYLEIEKGLEASRTLVLIMSANAFGSDWVSLERSTSLFRDPTNHQRRFIPLLLNDCEIPAVLRRYKYIDFREEDENKYKQLLSDCQLKKEIESKNDITVSDHQRGYSDNLQNAINGSYDLGLEFTENFVSYVSMDTITKLWGNYIRKRHEKDFELVEITDTFGSIEALLKYYIEPNCQNINPANYDEDEPDAVVRTPVFQFLNSYFNREYVVQGDGRNQLFVLSDAGLGKTSLLLMIKLCNLLSSNGGQEYDTESKKRIELIKLDAEALEKVRRICNKNETILLLDALDEDPLAWHKPELRLFKVLQESSRFRRVLISCRTQFFPEKGVSMYGTQEKISIRGYVCPMIFLSLFDQKQVYEYLEKRFPKYQDPENEVKQQKSIGILKKAKSLSFRPFLLSHIEDLLESENQEWSELSVYDELVSVWLRREVRKKSAMKIEEKDLWQACVTIAVKMQESGKRHLSENELGKIINAIPEVRKISYIEYGSKSLLNRNSAGDFRFSHFSVQEYFLSKYIMSLAETQSEDNRIKQIPVNRKMIRLTRKSLEFISFHINKQWSYSDKFLLERLVLDGFDFSHGNWSGCSFRESSLRDTNFENANLAEANFSKTILNGSILNHANCEKTLFTFADLTNASLENVNSEKANFEGTTFNNTNLRGLTNLGKLPSGTMFINTIMPNGKREIKKRIG